ncbi:MAG TPA: hypothetical protein VEQ40_12900 [Pyrinomonadaceae bacterium]|nr:hypothetical protein [Pyrinomonadaceae bacterium]
MPKKKASNQSKRLVPPGPIGEAFAQAAEATHAVSCGRIDTFANNEIRKACAKKQFEQTTGNCNDKHCQQVEQPKIVPCFRLRWGDGPNDQLETEDTEILCLTVCNPYSNVALNNFTVQLIVTDINGMPVPNQPDGTPSVLIKPSYMICFDDIPPCNPQRPLQSCVSREVVMINRGAIPGKYRIFVIYCFQACFTELNGQLFELELVSS